MEFSFTKEEEALRQEVRSFLDAELPKDWIMPIIFSASDLYKDDVLELHRVMAPKLAQKGWLCYDWPEEYGGQGGSQMMAAIIQEELGYRGSPGMDPQGIYMLGPLIIHFGTEKQKQQHLPPIARGEILWCEGYSEPEAGSDLASVQTMAVEDGDHFVINGQKLWTSGASKSEWCHLIVRTDFDLPKKHQGLTYFLLDMKTPGITVRPIQDMCEGQSLAEVFFDNVRVPAENILGGRGHGWEMAMALLNLERGGDTNEVGRMRGFYDLITQYVKERGLIREPGIQQYLADIYMEIETSRMVAYNLTWLTSQGQATTAQASTGKLFCTDSSQRCASTMLKILGSYGRVKKDSKWAVLQGKVAQWYLKSFSTSLARGTSEIQRNILAIRGLGLPRD